MHVAPPPSPITHYLRHFEPIGACYGLDEKSSQTLKVALAIPEMLPYDQLPILAAEKYIFRFIS